MKRHPFNVFSLVFGIVLILLAAQIAFPARGWFFGHPPLVAPRGGDPGRLGTDESLVHNDAQQEDPWG